MIEVEERIAATVTTYRLARMGNFQIALLPELRAQIRGSRVLRVWRQQGELTLIEAYVSDHWHPVSPQGWGALLRDLGD